MGGKKLTKERYNYIKPIIENIPKNTQGVGKLYEGLYISDSTASAIRKSKDFEDYHKMNVERLAQYEKKPKPAHPISYTDSDVKIIKKLERVIELLEAIEEQASKNKRLW